MWDRFLPNTPAFDPILAGMAGLLLLTFLWTLILSLRFRALGKRYRTLLGATAGGEIENLLYSYMTTAQEAHDRSLRAAELAEALAEQQKRCFQHTGVIRYDAFREMSGHLSFSLALLDARKDGFVLTSVMGRDGCRLYAKAIQGGHSDAQLTDEEHEAIRLALEPVVMTVKGTRSR